ncbi:uncharacterized protein MELLADRAFT_110397 [Melampsora larici-populina 98AG31]|uniref:Uncharacterized protein n=1 Tax=Melampsora larici-populina (strain 98AG31 / pathotype 3-4-7) TaxID=747676 RepID=F4RZP1_MELLP|nr:uncharacterized protein MELLADRAFT_110397 [Melampsora larici-populina 98AG31]EGG02035.1 hypothetical protein MELLADRAFT_110397 [Melampsora larici-populina 98AG31]
MPGSSNNTPLFQRTTSVEGSSQRQGSTPGPHQSTSQIHSNGQLPAGSRSATPVSRKRKWRKSNETPKNPKCPSLRQERMSMTPQVKEADEQTVQKHFRLMAGVGRSKADFPKSPTLSDLENMPQLTVDYETAPLGEAVPNLIRHDQLQPTWKPEDMEHTASGMLQYCRRRLQQYGIPYAHIDYRLKHMRRYNINEAILQRDQKRDRQQQRQLRLAKRRKEMCELEGSSPFARFGDLFEDERLCSSDESDEEVMNEDRVRHTPVWRSSLATSLVENIDQEYHKMRQGEFPKRSGRKPAKRVLSNYRPEGGKLRWPAGLPKDCYSDELHTTNQRMPTLAESATDDIKTFHIDEELRLQKFTFLPG